MDEWLHSKNDPLTATISAGGHKEVTIHCLSHCSQWVTGLQRIVAIVDVRWVLESQTALQIVLVEVHLRSNVFVLQNLLLLVEPTQFGMWVTPNCEFDAGIVAALGFSQSQNDRRNCRKIKINRHHLDFLRTVTAFWLFGGLSAKQLFFPLLKPWNKQKILFLWIILWSKINCSNSYKLFHKARCCWEAVSLLLYTTYRIRTRNSEENRLAHFSDFQHSFSIQHNCNSFALCTYLTALQCYTCYCTSPLLKVLLCFEKDKILFMGPFSCHAVSHL